MRKSKTLYITKIGNLIFIQFENNINNEKEIETGIKLFTYSGGMEIVSKIALEFLNNPNYEKPTEKE